MKSSSSRNDFRLVAVIFTVISLVASAGAPAAASGKLAPEEVVSKHLAAIGTAEARSAATTFVILGDVKFSYKSTKSGTITGKVVLASEGEKTLIGMMYPNSDYPHERLGFDGQKLTTGFIKPGTRSALGSFFLTYQDLFKEGLIGGELMTGWSLRNLDARSPKLSYEGIKKVEGRDTHVISYMPRKGSPLSIRLYFDAETFQHVRSDYERTIGARLGAGVDNSGSQRSTHYEMTEDFSDFRKEGALTLPHAYKLRLRLDNQVGTTEFEWNWALNQYAFNNPIPADSYNVEAFNGGK